MHHALLVLHSLHTASTFHIGSLGAREALHFAGMQ